MSVTIEFGDEGGPSVQVATNRGWEDVGEWADELLDGNETYPELMHLIDHGDSEDLPALVENIDNALANDPPDDESVAETLSGLRSAVKRNESSEYALIGDGFESGFGD